MFIDRYDSECMTNDAIDRAKRKWECRQRAATVKATGEVVTVGPMFTLWFGVVDEDDGMWSDEFLNKEDSRRTFKTSELIFKT